MKGEAKIFSKKKHSDDMRRLRARRKQAGVVEIRLGWGAREEHDILRELLKGLRNSATSAQIRDLATNLRIANGATGDAHGRRDLQVYLDTSSITGADPAPSILGNDIHEKVDQSTKIQISTRVKSIVDFFD